MTELAAATEMEDRFDAWAQAPLIEKAASDQLAKVRVKVDRWALEPKHAGSQP